MIKQIVVVLLLLYPYRQSSACGPYLPDTWLYEGHETRTLHMPEANFYHEMDVIVHSGTDYAPDRPGWTDFRAESKALETIAHALPHAPTDTTERFGLSEEFADLIEALKTSGAEGEARKTLTARYADLRFRMQSAEGPDPNMLDSQKDLLDSVPPEFALYLRGALAFRAAKLEEAVKS